MNYLTCDGDITQTRTGNPRCSTGWSYKTEEQVISELGLAPMTPETYEQLSQEIVMLFIIAFGVKLVKQMILQPIRG